MLNCLLFVFDHLQILTSILYICALSTAFCDRLTLTNGAIVYNPTSRLVDTVASFSCSTGYRLSSYATRTCQSDRQWSGSPPICMGKYYKILFF